MDQNTNKNHIIDTVFVILLLLLFVLSSLTVIAIGASIYKKNVAQVEYNYSQRIAGAYITEKVRQSDANGGIFVKEVFGKNVLVIEEKIGGTLYYTYIYEYDGYLREFYTRADNETFYPQSGQKIIEINSIDTSELTENLLKVDITLPDGSFESVVITKRSVKS